MSQCERIRYSITGYNFTEISRRKGSIEYQLTDDFGNERTVTAMAQLNLFNKVSRIKPIYHRELPLIQALANTKLNQSVTVDFSAYNKKYPRGSMRKQKITVPSISVKSSYLGPIDSLGSIAENKSRLMKLTLVSIAGVSVFSYFMVMFI